MSDDFLRPPAIGFLVFLLFFGVEMMQSLNLKYWSLAVGTLFVTALIAWLLSLTL